METVRVDSSLEGEIEQKKELIEKLTEAIATLSKTVFVLQGRSSYTKFYNDKHRIMTEWIHTLRSEISIMEEFPIHNQPPMSYTIRASKMTTPHLSPKELAEPVQRKRAELYHSNKNLATERKINIELLELERERERQTEVQASDAAWVLPIIHFIRNTNLKRLPQKRIKGLIMSWADEIEHVSHLVLRDSRKSAPTPETRRQLYDLSFKGMDILRQRYFFHKEEFAKQWDSLESTRNTFAKLKLDLTIEIGRHKKGHAESERQLQNKRLEVNNLAEKLNSDLSNLYAERAAAKKYLITLQNKQRELN